MSQSPEFQKMREMHLTLRSAGLRVTGPRVAVLKQLEVARTPLTHADIVETLAEQGFDRATLYRNLIDMSEVGIVKRTDLGDHMWRYELKKKNESDEELKHPHFTCSDCGTVECLPDIRISAAQKKKVPKSVMSHKVEIQLRGVCDNCAA